MFVTIVHYNTLIDNFLFIIEGLGLYLFIRIPPITTVTYWDSRARTKPGIKSVLTGLVSLFVFTNEDTGRGDGLLRFSSTVVTRN